ncbi:MAG: GTPase domain-containing protein [Synergistaceae bacterium]|nr:GTPase domain-containing protein [Synergistaceae bacterium]
MGGGYELLENAYKTLEDEANSSPIEFGTAITNTEEFREYHFTISGKHAKIHVNFCDFPGGWLNSQDNSEEAKRNYSKIVDIAKKSDVIMAVINMPYIRSDKGAYIDNAKIDEIQKIIRLSLEGNSDRDKLILLVPMKCEAYVNEPAKLNEDIRRLFSETVELAEANESRVALGIVPVQTIGNAKFSRFRHDDPNDYKKITGEVFRKVLNLKFSPQNVDQPLRFALSFFMSHFDDLPQDLKDVLTKIQKDMKLNEFDIVSGVGLINGEGITRHYQLREPEPVKPDDDPVDNKNKKKKKKKEPKQGNKYKIAIMGASGVGKTVFLGSYFNLVSLNAKGKYTIEAKTQDAVKRITKLISDLLLEKRKPLPTSERIDFSFYVSKLDMDVEMFDLQGGSVSDMDVWDMDKVTDDLTRADGALFFISGEDLVKNPERTWADNMVFSTAISVLREDKLADIPIQFVITKGDTIPDVSLDELKKRIAALIKRATTSSKAGGFIEDIFFKKGQRVHVYKTEAMGKWPSVDELPTDYEPKNVIEPMDELITEMYTARQKSKKTWWILAVAGLLIAAVISEAGLFAWDRHSWNKTQEKIERALRVADYPAVQKILEDFKSPSLVLPFFRADRNVNDGYAKYEAALYSLVQADISAINENVLPPMTQDLKNTIKRVNDYLDVKNFASIAPAHYEQVNGKKWYFNLVELFNYDVSNAKSSPDELMRIIRQCLEQNTPVAWQPRVNEKIEGLVRAWCKVLPVDVKPEVLDDYISAADSLVNNPRISERVRNNLEAQKEIWSESRDDRWAKIADEWIREAGNDKEKAVKTLEQRLKDSPSQVVTERVRKVLANYYLEIVNQWLSEYKQDTDIPRLKALMNNYPAMTDDAKKKLSDGIQELDRFRLEKAASLLARSRSLQELSNEAIKYGADMNSDVIKRVVNSTSESLLKDQIAQIRNTVMGYVKDENFGDGRKKIAEDCTLLRNSIRPLTASDSEHGSKLLEDVKKFENSLMREVRTAHLNACRQEFNRNRNTTKPGDIADCVDSLNDFLKTWTDYQSSEEFETVGKVLNFLTTIQNGVQGRLYVVRGDFREKDSFFNTPEIYIKVIQDRQTILKTISVEKAEPAFGNSVNYTWKVNNPLGFYAIGDGNEKKPLWSYHLDVSGFFGYRRLSTTLEADGCTLNIRFDANIPSCPW